MAHQLHRATENPQERQSRQNLRQEGGPESSRQEQGGRQEQDNRQNEANRQNARSGQGTQGRSNGGGQGRSNGGGQGRSNFSVPMIAMRSFSQLYDMQMAATRIMLQTQASAACAFGWPDFSGLFRVGDDRSRRVFSAGTEQIMHLAEQATQATSEVQQQLGRMMEFHAVKAAENFQQGLEELGHQAEESLQELKDLARRQVDETMQATQVMSDETRESMREGGEQFRQTIRQGADQGRQNIAQMGEAGREQGQQAGEQAQEGSREGGEQARGGQEDAHAQERGGSAQKRRAA